MYLFSVIVFLLGAAVSMPKELSTYFEDKNDSDIPFIGTLESLECLESVKYHELGVFKAYKA